MKKNLKNIYNSGECSYDKVQRNTTKIVELVKKIVISICKEEGFEFIRVKYLRKNNDIIRVYLNKPGGITIEDCAIVSRQLSDILDVEWESHNSYYLEVSSPGLD